MIAENRKLIRIGRIGSTHGLKGWVKIISFTNSIENIFNYLPWLIGKKNEWKIAQIEDARVAGNHLLAKFENIDTPEDAKKLTNLELVIYRDQLPEAAEDEGEYYWSDLEGLTVYNEEDICLGVIDHVFATGANDVLVVKGNKEHLIPYLFGQTILQVDLKNKKMIVAWDAEF